MLKPLGLSSLNFVLSYTIINLCKPVKWALFCILDYSIACPLVTHSSTSLTLNFHSLPMR